MYFISLDFKREQKPKKRLAFDTNFIVYQPKLDKIFPNNALGFIHSIKKFVFTLKQDMKNDRVLIVGVKAY